MKLIYVSGLVCLGASSALAQPPPPPPPMATSMVQPAVVEPVQTVLPGIPSTATGGTIDIRGDYTYFEDLDGLLLGFALEAQYISPSGLGGYATMPFSYVNFDEGGLFQDISESGVGNLELGGMYVLHNSPVLDFFGKAGVALDTAGEFEALFGPITQLVPRGNNALPSGGGSTWLRGHGGVRTKGEITAGASAGFDLPLDSDSGNDGISVNVDGLFVFVGAVGFNQPGFGVSAGLTYILATGAADDDDDFLNFNANIDFPVGPKTKMFGSFGINLDNLDDQTVFSIGVGARFGI